MTRGGTLTKVMFGLIAAMTVALLGAGTAWAKSSTAWSGYKATHDKFRYVRASWTIPTLARCKGATGGQSYSLVGLGTSQGNIVGIDVNDSCAGQFIGGDAASYMYQQGDLVLEQFPKVGDRVTATVRYRAPYYYLSFVDHTDSQLSWYQRVKPCKPSSCSRGAAEVFNGKLNPATGTNPMADWRRLTFHGIAISDGKGHHGSFAKNRFWTTVRFKLYDPKTDFALGPQAVASPLSHKGTQFTDIWKHFDT